MPRVTVQDLSRELSEDHYRKLEAGNILFFPRTPIAFGEEERRFLVAQRQTGAGYHKNIAYRPAEDALTGVARGSDRETLRRLLGSFSRQAAEAVARLLPRYAASWRVDFASFRPFEESGRNLSLHARNDLLHVDAFPTRPTHGDRILRFFTNLNPTQPRVWLTGEAFGALAERFAGEARLAPLARRKSAPLARAVARVARRLGWRQLAASPYDALMHRFHNFLKENAPYQATCSKERWEFPPQSSWMVFTDLVSHAVLSGQFALEQTFLVGRAAMLSPEQAPVQVLERITGRLLTGDGERRNSSRRSSSAATMSSRRAS